MWAIKGLLRTGLIEPGTGRITEQGWDELTRARPYLARLIAEERTPVSLDARQLK
jgi:hypothetical protein